MGLWRRYLQSQSARYYVPAGILLLIVIGDIAISTCGRRQMPATQPAAIAQPRIVCLLPQATDLLVSMGCGDHLAGISDFDAKPDLVNLPRVGNYLNTNWEVIAAIRPAFIVTHYGVGQAPAGFADRADQLGITVINLLTETLDGPDPTSIYYAIDQLGKACNEPAKAAKASERLRGQIAKVKADNAAKPRVSALILIGDEGLMAASADTYLGQLLDIAGGTNVLPAGKVLYPTIDNETLTKLNPDVIIQLLPNASDDLKLQVSTRWKLKLPDISAVKHDRLIMLSDWYVLLPGYHVGTLAEQFARGLHPSTDKTNP